MLQLTTDDNNGNQTLEACVKHKLKLMKTGERLRLTFSDEKNVTLIVRLANLNLKTLSDDAKAFLKEWEEGEKW